MSVRREDNTQEFLKDVARAQQRFVTQGGLVISGQMKRRAPVDFGNLRRSITSTTGSESGEVYSDTGPGTDYAEFVEYGTSNPNYPAQPYAEPGFQAARPKIDSIAAREFNT